MAKLGRLIARSEVKSSLIKDDPVNHPKHYNLHPSGVECIMVVEHMPFNIGTAMKYLWRAGLKDNNPTIQDYDKAIWYINREKERLNGLANKQ